jgi:hypothetical protein
MRTRVLWVGTLLVTGCAVLGFTATLAQAATPLPFPATPEPAECIVAPAVMADVLDLLATPVAASPVAASEPLAIPDGAAADEETAAAVVATLRQVLACANVGDPLRFTALFTDDFIREFYAGAALSDVIRFLSFASQPLPVEQRRAIVPVGAVEMLDDGLAGMTIVLDEPADPRTEEPDYAILEEVDGRCLVDGVREG